MMKRSASKSLLTSLWAQSVSRASSRAVAGSSTQLAQTFVPTSQYDQFRKYYHTSASNCNSIANAPRQSPQQSSQQALNRSTTAIRDNLLLLLTPAKKDQINLQSVLYDLQEITDASLTVKVFEEHILGQEEKLTQREFTLAINCLDKTHKVRMIIDLFHAVTQKNPAILGDLPLIALLRALRQSEVGAREGLAIYKAALKDSEHYPQLAYNSIAANSAIGLCYNLKMTTAGGDAVAVSNNTNGIDEALSIKETLDRLGVTPHFSSFGLLISIAAHFQRYVVAKALYKEYVDLYHIIATASGAGSSSSATATSSIFVETAMISAALRAKDFAKCYELAQKISKLSRLSQNPYATCHMLVVFIQTKEWRIGMEIIERYLKDGAMVDAVLARIMKKFIQSYMQDRAHFQHVKSSSNMDSVLAMEELESLSSRAIRVQNTLFNKVLSNLESYDMKEGETIKMLVEYADLIAARGWMGRVVEQLLVNGRPTTRLANFVRAAAGKLSEHQMEKELLSLLERTQSYEEDFDAQNVVVTVLGHVLSTAYAKPGGSKKEDIEFLLNTYIRRKEQLNDAKNLKLLVTPILKFNEVQDLHNLIALLGERRGVAVSEDMVNTWLEQRTSLRNQLDTSIATTDIPSPTHNNIQQLDVL